MNLSLLLLYIIFFLIDIASKVRLQSLSLGEIFLRYSNTFLKKPGSELTETIQCVIEDG